jgi:hypothetical protein
MKASKGPMSQAMKIPFRLAIVIVSATFVPTSVRADEQHAVPPSDGAAPAPTPDDERSEHGDVGKVDDGGEPQPSKPPLARSPVIEDDIEPNEEASSTDVAPSAVGDEGTLPTLTFLGFERAPEHEREARLVEDLMLDALRAESRFALSTARDIDEAMTRAANDQEKGCNIAVEACARTVALALGARYVLTGSVTVTDGSVMVDLVLLDTLEGLPKSRERITARRMESFQRRLNQTLTNLLCAVHGGPRITVDEERPVRAFHDTEVVVGATALGLGTATLIGVSGLGIGGLVVAGLAVPDAYLPWGDTLVAAGFIAPLVGGAMALAVAIVVDLVAGAPVAWARAVALTATSALLSGVGFSVATIGTISVASSTLASLDFARNPTGEFQFDYSFILPTMAVVALASIGSGVTAGLVSAALSLGIFAVTESTPPFGEE